MVPREKIILPVRQKNALTETKQKALGKVEFWRDVSLGILQQGKHYFGRVKWFNLVCSFLQQSLLVASEEGIT